MGSQRSLGQGYFAEIVVDPLAFVPLSKLLIYPDKVPFLSQEGVDLSWEKGHSFRLIGIGAAAHPVEEIRQ